MIDLTIDQQEIQCAQYLPGHQTCKYLHGHTYIIKDIHVFASDDLFIDFGQIKSAIKKFDHRLFINRKHSDIWMKAAGILSSAGCDVQPVLVDGDATVENIATLILRSIRDIYEPGILGVKFTLMEGLHQGIVKTWGRTK